MASNEVVIVVKAEDKASKVMQEAGQSIQQTLKGIGASVAGTALGFGVFQISRVFTDNLTDALKGAVTAASATSESVNKMRVVFGDVSREVEVFAQNSSRDFGLAKQSTMEYLGTFGNLLTSMGLSKGLSADMSEGIVKLASDLASFNNIGVDEALEKIRAGLVGEAEPLRAVGVNLNEASIQAKAFSLGLIKQGETMSAATKAQASYALIMEQTTNAQGDFARTSDGLANQQRILTSQVEDLKAKFGEALLPVVLELTTAMNDLVSVHGDEWARTFAGGVSLLDSTMRGAAKSAGDLFAILGSIQVNGNGLGDMFKMGASAIFSMATGPFTSALGAARNAIAPNYQTGAGGRPAGGWNTVNEEAVAQWATDIETRTRGGVEKIAAPAGAGGAGSAKANPLVEAWKNIQEQFQQEQQKVLESGGLAQLDALRKKQDDETATIREMAQRAHDILGIDMAEAVKNSFQTVSDYEKALVDDRIEGAKKATAALQDQMEAEAKLAQARQSAMQSLLAQFGQTMGGGGAFGAAFGAIASGNNVSDAQLQAAIAAGNAATNARSAPRIELSSDLKVEGGS